MVRTNLRNLMSNLHNFAKVVLFIDFAVATCKTCSRRSHSVKKTNRGEMETLLSHRIDLFGQKAVDAAWASVRDQVRGCNLRERSSDNRTTGGRTFLPKFLQRSRLAMQILLDVEAASSRSFRFNTNLSEGMQKHA